MPIDDADGGPAVTYKISIGTLRTAVISPSSNGDESCGTSSLRWANVYGQAADVTGTLTQTIGAILTDKPALSSTATWNAAGVTFTHIIADITNTASAAASRVVNLKVGGSSIWQMTTAGAVTQASSLTISAGGLTVTAGGITVTAGTTAAQALTCTTLGATSTVTLTATTPTLKLKSSDNSTAAVQAVASNDAVSSALTYTFAGQGSWGFGTTVLTTASTADRAGLNLPHGTAPTAPVNGDMWTTTAGLFVRINGVTKTVTLT